MATDKSADAKWALLYLSEEIRRFVRPVISMLELFKFEPRSSIRIVFFFLFFLPGNVNLKDLSQPLLDAKKEQGARANYRYRKDRNGDARLDRMLHATRAPIIPGEACASVSRFERYARSRSFYATNDTDISDLEPSNDRLVNPLTANAEYTRREGTAICLCNDEESKLQFVT